ncbi:PspC domain-containing protein [Bifidobacterium psychraerophilum]|uniref:PspC domain-containing protein n=1 Tax=Bifidobacterium psychraerophilum TaxID=218140 RepID=UPI003118E853
MNNMHNPQDHPRDGQQDNPQTPPSADARFFAWVRASGIRRSDPRWISGVCAGLARRLGWNEVLVRALMLASILCFGIGAALYGFAWFVLPDDRSDSILLEDLIAGRWDWSCVGVFLCFGTALVFPGVGLFVLALAAFALFLLMQWGRQSDQRRQRSSGQSGPEPYGNQGYATYANNPARNGGVPGNGTAPSTDDGYDPSGYTGADRSSSPAQPAADVASGYRPSEQRGFVGPDTNRPGPSYASPYSSATPSSQPPMAAAQPYPSYRYQYQPRTVYARRRPAGPVIVSAVVGVLLVSAAAMLVVASRGSYSVDQTLAVATMWSCAGTILLGVVLVLLGCAGRRSGGLIPFALISALVSITLMGISGAYGYTNLVAQRNTSGYERVQLSSNTTLGSTSADMRRYARGILIDASATGDAKGDVATIDLSGYRNNNGTHEVTSADGKSIQSACPTGDVRLAVVHAQAVVVMPRNCTYSVNGNRGTSYAETHLSGTFVRIGDSGSLSLNESFSMSDNGESQSLPGDLDTAELNIDATALLDGEVSVVYTR